MRKRMYLIPAGCIVFILFFTIFGERGLLRIYHLHKEKHEIQQRVEAMRQENQKLVREIDALKNDRRYLESIARKDFGLVRQNEIIYQFPPAAKPGVEVTDNSKPAPQKAQ
ncbi:MAG TPA: septum formation initiator family protein [Geobacteraceae bacterium]